jgi:hypothetical protein
MQIILTAIASVFAILLGTWGFIRASEKRTDDKIKELKSDISHLETNLKSDISEVNDSVKEIRSYLFALIGARPPEYKDK